jgi:hypothetical protein
MWGNCSSAPSSNNATPARSWTWPCALWLEEQGPSIDQDAAFATVDALGAIVATYTTHASRAGRLAVDDASARLRVAPDAHTELLAQRRIEVLPHPVEAPLAEVMIRRLPGGEFVREQPPGAATANHVEDGVQNLTDRVCSGTTDALGSGRSGSRRANSASVRSVR